jgi:putative phosphoesterase
MEIQKYQLIVLNGEKMRVAIISDLHSNLAALKAVMKDLRGVERVLCGGDLVGYCAEPNEVIRVVRKKRIHVVMGDHDHAVLTEDFKRLNRPAAGVAVWTRQNITEENLEYLGTVKERIEMQLAGHRLLVIHGSPSDPLRGRVYRESSSHELAKTFGDVGADLIVLGHTHRPLQRMVLGKLVVNPGSVGQPRDGNPKASYALLNLGKDIGVDFKRVEYDVESTAKVMGERGLPRELAARLFFGW